MTPENANIPADCEALSEAFLSLHEADGFSRLPPSSLLHDSVPMSFVMSAGLIQVENNLDTIIEETGGTFAFTQPCFRHFDMKQVGEDPTRLSLFHMSAAFHIGNTARETVLPRLWKFLTEILQLEPEKLWISYLDDPKLGKDTASYQCWRDLGVSDDNLVGLEQEHCFWRQRSTGQIASDGKKCGPHTEVFYERSEVNCEGCPHDYKPDSCIGTCRKGRFVEISNSLFIESYLDDDDGLITAETPFAECVVGLERIAMILQDVPSVYHTQRFKAWREMLEAQLPAPKNNHEQEVSINIILDHLSAFIKLLQDGAPEPGQGGRKAIMRKLLRGSVTRLLLHDLEAEHVFHTLVTELCGHHHYLQIVQKERTKYINTLKKVIMRLERGDLKLLSKLHSRPQHLEGVPDILLHKYYPQTAKLWNNRAFSIK